MFKVSITTTWNGKPIDQIDFEDQITKMLLDGSAEAIKNHIRDLISPDEAESISINMIGDDIENISFEISGPQEVIAKINASMNTDD